MTKEQFDQARQLTSDIDSLQRRIHLIDEMKESKSATVLYNSEIGQVRFDDISVFNKILATIRNGLTSDLKRKQDELREL